MRRINAFLNGLTILGALYTFLTLGNGTSVFIILTSASAIATTLSYQKKPLAWFAYISNILCGTLLFFASFVVMFGGSAQRSGLNALTMGIVLLLVSIPFIISVFFIKIRYFPKKLKTVS
jgi:hypothetical protein